MKLAKDLQVSKYLIPKLAEDPILIAYGCNKVIHNAF